MDTCFVRPGSSPVLAGATKGVTSPFDGVLLIRPVMRPRPRCGDPTSSVERGA